VNQLARFQLNSPTDRLKLLLAIVLLAGIFFRLTNLDQQIYWHDEAYTSLRISGYNAIEVKQLLFQGNVISVADLLAYQRPTAEKTVVDTVRSLMTEDPQHPPVYYVLVTIWAQLFGASIAAIRSLSALLSLLIFPGAYWLCRELFAFAGKSSFVSNQIAPLMTGLTIALMAVSPYHVLYAQEARQYPLWAVLILFSSAALLRAIRVNTRFSWVVYTICLVLGLYTHPFMLLVAIGQGIYLLVVNRARIDRIFLSYLLAFGISVLAFAPWLKIIIEIGARTGTSWTAIPIPLPILLKTWGLHLERAFLIPTGDFGFDDWLVYLSLPVLLLLVIYAFYTLCRYAPLRIWLFVVILTGSVLVPLVLPDLVIGGQRSTSSRYLVPTYLGMQLAVAYLLASKLLSLNPVKQKLWRGITAGLLSISLIAGAVNTQAETVWTKVVSYHLPIVARIINSAPQPLVVSTSFGTNFGNLLALSHLVEPKVKFQLIDVALPPAVQQAIQVPTGFSSVFLLNPSETMQQQLVQQPDRAELIFNDSHLFLWKLRDHTTQT
jgi:uncharacterized membrane protein